MNKVYKYIRIITVAPVMAMLTVLIIEIFCKGTFPSIWHLTYSIFFLGILPLLAYPLQKYIPGFREKGREGQRNLAIIFAASGFTMGCLLSFILPSSLGVKVIFVEYFLGSMAVTIFNKAFHIRMSGHACGVMAPVALFIYFGLYKSAVILMIVAILVFVSSIKMKRHTLPQLIGGGVVPFICIGIIELILYV